MKQGKLSKAPIRLKGLDGKKKYKLEEINLYPGTWSALKKMLFFQKILNEYGFNPQVNASRTSIIVKNKWLWVQH